MKITFIIFTALLFAACASSNKNAAQSATPQPTATPAPTAKVDNSKSQSVVECKRGSETRTIEIEPLEKGCNLWYTVAGNKKKVAWSTRSNQHCKNVEDKMKGHLTDAGYSCEDKK